MPRSTLSLVLLAAVAADVGIAAAQPTVRDHRTPQPESPPPATGQPGVRDHRDGAAQPAASTSGRRYRRRPGPRWMLPTKFDLGVLAANTDKGFLPGGELRIGVHWASLSPVPTTFDIGLGVLAGVLVGPDDGATTEPNVGFFGGYLELGRTLSMGRHTRTWATGRGEYFARDAFGEDGTGFGVVGRLAAELYLSGVGIEPRGLFLGSYAIGLYTEAGLRRLGPDVNALQVSAGLTFRTPLVFSP